ncbi:hypothetical protein [Streptomyces sp. NPDC008125]|uniref:hypothetical protein n=1 Tax=Streptomyces sp. NPDC008125 TaxID=3364811 RepID=UPI0036E52866
MEPVPTLVHSDSPFVNFRHFDFAEGGHGYRGVDIKRFRLPAEAPDDREVLAALIAHPRFRDTYDGAGVQDPGVQDRPRHGQWWLDRITPDTYAVVDDATAVGLVHAWAAQHGDLPEELATRLREDVYGPIRTATTRYLLGQLPRDALHDYGPLHIDSYELVLIDRPGAVLTLLVAADD